MNATLVGQFIMVLAVIMAVVCFYLGKRKTQTPVLASIIGFFTALIPPLAIIYLIVLVVKKDVNEIEENG